MKRLQKYHLTVHYNREKDVLVYDRKLKPGSGIPIYGLEVCQSLHLPNDFIKYRMIFVINIIHRKYLY